MAKKAVKPPSKTAKTVSITAGNPPSAAQIKQAIALLTKPDISGADAKKLNQLVDGLDITINSRKVVDLVDDADNDLGDVLQKLNLRANFAAVDKPNLMVHPVAVVAAVVVVTGISGDTPEKPEKPPSTPPSDKPTKPEKPEKPEKPQKPEKPMPVVAKSGRAAAKPAAKAKPAPKKK